MQSGIVLKNFAPKKQKFLILDRDLGPIEAACPPAIESKLCRGAVVSYDLIAQKHISLLGSVDILDIPFAWAREDILFLHHLLELLCYFLPARQEARPLFELMTQLYQAPVMPKKLHKKLVIARCFLLLGVCNPVPDQYPDFEHRESELDAWLLACIAEHPQAGYLQTLKFYV